MEEREKPQSSWSDKIGIVVGVVALTSAVITNTININRVIVTMEGRLNVLDEKLRIITVRTEQLYDEYMLNKGRVEGGRQQSRTR